MNQLLRFTALETKLFFRDPAAWLITLVMPTFILVILGSVPGLRTPDAAFGGQRFIDLFAPSLLVVTLATLGVNALPIRIATYREKGVLRRFSTTPVRPATLLVAQLVLNLGVAIVSLLLVVLVGRLVFEVPVPQHIVGFGVAFLLGMTALFGLGLLIAAVAPTVRSGTALSLPLFFISMFLGGVYLPRVFLPDFLLRIGEFTPPGVQAMVDAWMGSGPQLPQLLTMAAITLLSGAIAVRSFRWE
jgi:ABC-2 type transport system permease protein